MTTVQTDPDLADLNGIFAGSALAPFDTITSLLAQYKELHARIEKIAGFVADGMEGAMQYFLSGNSDSSRNMPSVAHLFESKGAIAALDSAYWSKAMQMTDVLDMMPQARRDDWYKSITDQTCPAFEETTVRNTFADLMASRSKFLAERVDGIFQGLSGEHVTNAPHGFGKRMIIASVLTEYSDLGHTKRGLINDLRAVVAKFMRRDAPKYSASEGLVQALKAQWGEWVPIDGGALKIRLYKKGTAHMEVHPDISWRLNMVLAQLYPRVIPPEFREKPRRRPQDVQLIQRPLPFAVVHALAELKPVYEFPKDDEENWRHDRRPVLVPNAVHFPSTREIGKHVLEEAEIVLESIGGVKIKGDWHFDYRPDEVLREIVTFGCVPDAKAHQFYPTRPKVAQPAVALAKIEPHHRCLEPSAGLGGLADFMPKDRTTCIEIAPLRAKVLEAKGFKVECADFLVWAEVARKAGLLFDRIVMNPPFDCGRWRAHLEAAAALLAPGGRLVSVLPVVAKNKSDLLPGLKCEFPQTFEGAFAGVSQDVVLLVAESAASAVQQPPAVATTAQDVDARAARRAAASQPPKLNLSL